MLSKRLIPVVAIAAFMQNFAAVAVQADNCTRVRAAFDVGSSGTKMKVWKINVCKSRIIEQLFPKTAEDKKLANADIFFKRDLVENERFARDRAQQKGKEFNENAYPRFSEDILIEAPEAFTRLKEAAKQFKPDDYIAVATEAFRQAQNADQLISKLESLGITVVIPAQQQEGMIEWMGVTADLRDSTERKPGDIVSWGIGAGSMQVAGRLKNGEFVQLSSKMASDSMHHKAVMTLKGDPEAKLIPATKNDIVALVALAKKEALSKSDAISEKLADAPLVVAVGGTINKSVKALLIKAGLVSDKAKTFTSDQVRQVLYGSEDQTWPGLVGKRVTDAVFAGIPADFVDNTISNVTLVYGVMQGLGITQARFSDVDNTYGAPFTKEFGIKTKARATQRSVVFAKAQVIAGSRKVTQADLEQAEEQIEASAPVSEAGTGSIGNPDENRVICNGTPGHVIKGKDCFISEPCRGLVTKTYCDGGLNDKTCTHKGNLNLVYNVCKY